MIPRIYQTNKAGFTVDGYPLGPTPRNPDVFNHPGPLPHLTARAVKNISPLGDQIRKTESRRIASFDEQHTEELRKFYGNVEGHDGAAITWATPVESSNPEAPKPLSPADIARMHGEVELRRIRGK